MYPPFFLPSQVGLDGENHICVGKLNLVDLAGSERQGKTGATVSNHQVKSSFYYIYIFFFSNPLQAKVETSA